MAEIDIQEKKGQPMWMWIAGIVALLVLVAVIWAVTQSGDERDDGMMRQDTVPTQTSGLDQGYDAVPPYVAFSRQSELAGSTVAGMHQYA